MKNTARTDIDSAGRNLSECRAQPRHDGTICGGHTIRCMACAALALILVLFLGTAALAEAPFASEAQPIEVGVATEVTIEDMGGYAYFSFMPSQSGLYDFYSTGSSDTYGYLYNAEGVILSSDDQGGEYNNFLISRELTAGVRYYFGARFWNTADTGTFTVQLDRRRGLISATASGDGLLRVAPNETAVLEVVATCTEGNVYYSWLRDGYQIEGADSATLTTEQLVGRASYNCIVSDDFGHEQWVYFTVEIDNQFYAEATDANPKVAPGGAVTLAVEAGCRYGEISYQWYDGNWNYDLSDYPIIEGATGSTLELTGVTENKSYFCRVSDEYGNSNEIRFYVGIDNQFYAEGTDTNPAVTPGGAVTLAVEAGCRYGEISYQWYDGHYSSDIYDYPIIEGATGATLELTGVTASKNYFCRVTDEYGNLADIWFFVRIENHLVARPAGGSWSSSELYVAENETATLRVIAQCDVGELTYEWQDNDGYTYPDETGAVFTTEPITGYRSYTCIVSDAYGNAERTTFFVSVENEFRVSNANRSNLIKVMPHGTAVLTVDASCRDGELTYAWTDNNGYGSLLDNNTSTLTLENVTERHRHICRVADKYGNSREVYFDVAVDNAFTMYHGYREIIYVPYGETTTLMASASCREGDLTYRWYCNDTDIEEQTQATLMTFPVDQAQTYTCHISDDYGNEGYTEFTVGVENGFSANAVGSNQLYLPENGTTTLCVDAHCREGGLTYSWSKSGSQYKKLSETTGTLTTEPLTESHTSYRCEVTDRYGNTGVVEYILDIDNELRAWAVSDTKISLSQKSDVTMQVAGSCSSGELSYSWIRIEYGPENNFTYTEPVTGPEGATFTARDVDSAVMYQCRVSDRYNNGVYVVFEIGWDNGFTATVQNPYRLVEPGETVELQVNASCTSGDLTYQWFEAPFSDAYVGDKGNACSSDEVLTVTCDRSRFYTCYVSDQYGNSANYRFYVIVKQGTENIVTDQDTPVTISEDSRAQAFSFTPTAAGSYRFLGSGNNPICAFLFDQNGTVRYFTGFGQGRGLDNYFDFFIKLEPGQAYTFVAMPSFRSTASFTVHMEYLDAEFHHAETQLVLPAGTVRIEREAFAGINAEEVVIPDGCEYIGPMAFANCPTLRLINIPDSVTFIADSAFTGTNVTILQEGVSGYGRQYAQQHGLGWVVPED